ncbi:MerR family transcriptional regulator [Streptomyces sp. BI20]|uniref:MerR family transcriptional regulator n=1 Tax=Streptomyces sp. BI20 TaxID=3403460 RepID=UPI003C72D020
MSFDPSALPPRTVGLADAARLAGVPAERARVWSERGHAPAAERDPEGRPLFGHDEVVRLMWLGRMVASGLIDADIEAAFDAVAVPAAGGPADLDAVFTALPEVLAARHPEAGPGHVLADRLRAVGSPLGLLPSAVTDPVAHLGPDALRARDLEDLLVSERLYGPDLAAFRTDTVLALAAHPELRALAAELDAAEAALDRLDDPEHPAVAETAALIRAYGQALDRAVAETAGEAPAGTDTGLSGDGEPDPEILAAGAEAQEEAALMPYPHSAARWKANILSFTESD